MICSIIATLLAILLPALNSAKSVARKSVELSAARQLMLGYVNYSTVNRDALLPGYLDSPHARDALGTPFVGPQLEIAARRYLWRLAPWLSFDIRALFPNDMADVLERLEHQSYTDFLYATSVSPTFGLNSEWIGGDLNAYGFLPPDHPLHDALDFRRFYISAMAQARHPERLMVFASARGVDPQTPAAGGSVAPIEGYFRITSPYFTELTGNRWNEAPYQASAPPQAYGHVSPRFRGTAVTAFIDAHVDAKSIDQLRDMRHWANWADAPDWRLPVLEQ